MELHETFWFVRASHPCGGGRVPTVNRARTDRNCPSEDFIAVMERWAAGYIPAPNSPVGGLTHADFAAMTMPVTILRGSPRDLYHPAWVCEQVQELLPHSRMIDPPWDIDIFAERMTDGKGLFSDWPLLAPKVTEWMNG